MRRSAALKVLGGVFLFVILGSLLSGEGRRNLGPLLASGVLVGFFLVIARLRYRPRQRAMQDEARGLHLSYSASDPFRMLDGGFSLFRRTARSYGEVANVMWGAWRGLQVRAFDYEHSESEDQVRRYSCAMASIPGGWPALVIRPETAVTTLADHLALPDIGFESERFDRAFEVRCGDRAFASALIDARMMEWLLELAAPSGFEIGGGWILAYRDQVQPWETRGVLELVAAFIDRIPPVMHSLYPAPVPPPPDLPA